MINVMIISFESNKGSNKTTKKRCSRIKVHFTPTGLKERLFAFFKKSFDPRNDGKEFKNVDL